MATVRPLPLADTTAKAGYDQVDPLVMWFLGGNSAPAATATGINDDDRYGLDLQNSGIGALSFRAIAGTNFGRIDGTGVAFGGAFTHTGTGVFTGLLAVNTLTVASGVTVTTGPVVMGGSATVANGFTVTTGAASLGGSLNVVGAATVGTLRVTGAVTVVGAVTMSSGLVVAATATFSGIVTMASTLNVSGVATFLSSAIANTFTSTAIAGAPFVANSTGVATSFNADMVDGLHADDFVVTGNYTGNGSTTRTITLGFQPKYVYIASVGSSSGTRATCHLLSGNGSDNIGFARLSGVTALTFLVVLDSTVLVSTGFQVEGGAGITAISNQTNDVYRYSAWR
ncbi:MAG TPA: hypothetical protein VMT30_09545 [Candidatus Saccharimonadia bacterium]|nr:hypothetical protein [Candidatus Saccharimonadia bacterium]